MATADRTIVKQVENARLYSDGTIYLENVRCSYPNVFVPKTTTDKQTGKVSEPKYSIAVLLPKDTHDEAKKLVARAINAILKEKNSTPDNPEGKLKADRKFLKDGDPKDEDDVGKPENKGMWVMTASERKAPVVLSNRKDPATGKAKRLTVADKDMIYGGCYVNVLVRPWWQNNADPSIGKRVNCGLSVVQFKRDGEPFGNANRITDEIIDSEFGAEDAEADADGDDL